MLPLPTGGICKIAACTSPCGGSTGDIDCSMYASWPGGFGLTGDLLARSMSSHNQHCSALKASLQDPTLPALQLQTKLAAGHLIASL